MYVQGRKSSRPEYSHRNGRYRDVDMSFGDMLIIGDGGMMEDMCMHIHTMLFLICDFRSSFISDVDDVVPM